MKPLRPLAPLAAAFLAAACAARGPRPAAPPKEPPKPAQPASAPEKPILLPQPSAVPPPSGPCFNSQYKFSCAIPPGFLMTQEAEGPGDIMTLVPQSMSSNATANLIVRAAPAGKLSLDQYVASRITRGLQGAEGVKHWDKFPAVIGAYSGVEVSVEREYASGPFRSRIFVFPHASDFYTLNYSASSDQFERDQKVVEKFLESLSFAP